MAKNKREVPETTGDETPTAGPAEGGGTLVDQLNQDGDSVAGDPGETAAEIPAAIDDGAKAAAEPAKPDSPTAASFEAPLQEAKARLEEAKAALDAAPDPAAETLRLGEIYQKLHKSAQEKKQAIDAEVDEALAAVKAEERRQGDKADARNKLHNAVSRAERDVKVIEEQQRMAANRKK